ncbi:hypothetical protein FACS1894147_05740 [Spirochaetia bacterium]|nr:hypothetical protein FACS1894147_05740 [Spirochaetia bacterium]
MSLGTSIILQIMKRNKNAIMENLFDNRNSFEITYNITIIIDAKWIEKATITKKMNLIYCFCSSFFNANNIIATANVWRTRQ